MHFVIFGLYIAYRNATKGLQNATKRYKTFLLQKRYKRASYIMRANQNVIIFKQNKFLVQRGTIRGEY